MNKQHRDQMKFEKLNARVMTAYKDFQKATGAARIKAEKALQKARDAADSFNRDL